MSDERRQHPDDAILSALIDDELPPEEATRLRARIAEDPELAARYETLRRADGEVRRAFASVDTGPVPERVLRLLRDDGEGGDRAAAARTAKVVPLRGLRRFYRPPAALAAGIALFFLGFALARVMLPETATAPGSVFVDAAGVLDGASPLYRVLEDVPSGETAPLEGGISATPRLTFKRSGGGYCRLVDVAGAGGASSALACRTEDAWRLRLAAFADGTPVAGDGYRPASDARSPAVDRAIDGLIEGAPLDAKTEAKLLQNDWSGAGNR